MFNVRFPRRASVLRSRTVVFPLWSVNRVYSRFPLPSELFERVNVNYYSYIVVPDSHQSDRDEGEEEEIGWELI